MRKLHSAFFREAKHKYFLDEIVTALYGKSNSQKEREKHEKHVLHIMDSHLVKQGVAKYGKQNNYGIEGIDFADEDEEKATEDKKEGYYFNFVGLVRVEDCIFKCFPKYIENYSEEEEKKCGHFSTVLKVLNILTKNNDRDSVGLYNIPNKEINPLDFKIHLLRQYYETGLFFKEENYIDTNGEGEIDWNRTIDEVQPFIKGNTPYYFETKTIEKREAGSDFIKNLHKAILSECSADLKETGLLKYLGLRPVLFEYNRVSNLGTLSYIEQKIRKELNVQNGDTQRIQLYNMLYYIREKEDYALPNSSIQIFGSRSFNLVWETVCKAMFDDLYNNKYHFVYDKLKTETKPNFGKIDDVVGTGLGRDGKESQTFFSLFGGPQWKMKNGDYPSEILAGLKPDIVTVKRWDKTENSENPTNVICLLDAKYFFIKASEDSKNKVLKIEGMPRAPDISKQFLYEGICSSLGHTVSNLFLVPEEKENWTEETIKDQFSVSYPEIQNALKHDLKDIKVISLNPDTCFKNFISQKALLDDFDVEKYVKQDREDKKSGLILFLPVEKNIEIDLKRGKVSYSVNTTKAAHSDFLQCRKVIFKYSDSKYHLYELTGITMNYELLENDEEVKKVNLILGKEEPVNISEENLNKIVNEYRGNIYSDFEKVISKIPDYE